MNTETSVSPYLFHPACRKVYKNSCQDRDFHSSYEHLQPHPLQELTHLLTLTALLPVILIFSISAACEPDLWQGSFASDGGFQSKFMSVCPFTYRIKTLSEFPLLTEILTLYLEIFPHLGNILPPWKLLSLTAKQIYACKPLMSQNQTYLKTSRWKNKRLLKTTNC